MKRKIKSTSKNVLCVLLVAVMMLSCITQLQPTEALSADGYTVSVKWYATRTNTKDQVSFGIDDDGSCIGFGIEYITENGSSNTYLVDLKDEPSETDVVTTVTLPGYPTKLYAILNWGTILQTAYLYINSMSVDGVEIFNGTLMCRSAFNYKILCVDYLGNVESNDSENAMLTQNNTASWTLPNDLSQHYPNGYRFYRDMYNFSNPNEIIESSFYRKALGPVKGIICRMGRETQKHGLCYGMAATTAAFIKYPSAISTFQTNGNYASSIINIQKNSYSSTFDFDALTYIKYAYLYQFDSSVCDEEEANKNNISGLCSAIKAYVNGTGDPFIINVAAKKKGLGYSKHCLFPIGYEEDSSYFTIIINDSNTPYIKQYFKISKADNSWSYNAAGLSFSSKTGYMNFSFLADRTYYLGVVNGSTCRSRSATDSSYLSEDSLLISSNSPIESEELTEINISTDASDIDTNEYPYLYWLKKNIREISIDAEEKLNVTVCDVYSSITASIPANKTAKFVVDDTNVNSFSCDVDSNTETNITFKTANDKNDIISVDISCVSNAGHISVTQTESGLSVDGVSDGTITLSKNDDIIDAQSINKSESKVEVVYDEFGESDDLTLNYKRHEHLYTTSTNYPTCTESGTITYTCTCGHSYIESLSASGHAFSGSKCIKCGYDKSTDCSCSCHKTGFPAFLFKILNFFQKLFGKNKVCDCGTAH